MSKPTNPLERFNTYEVKHILLAFDNAEAACDYRLPADEKIGPPGTILKSNVSCGNAMVVVNELENSSYHIRDLVWTFNFFGVQTPTASSAGGELTIADARGNQFPSFIRRVSKKLKMSQTRITYSLITVIQGREGDKEVPEKYICKPLIIDILDISSGFRPAVSNLYTMNFVFLYNTSAQLPNLGKLDQFTITNSEKNPSKSIPRVNTVSKVDNVARFINDIINGPRKETQIRSRLKTQVASNLARSERIEKSAPMRNLKELFAGFEAELQEMRFENRRQLQEFIAIVNDGSSKKIKPPKQKNVKDGSLPLRYKVNLAREFENFPLDNRNLLTEQIEVSQEHNGIHSFTVPPGSTLVSTVDALMKMSRSTADMVRSGRAYKTVVSVVSDCEGVITITLNVVPHVIPRNKQDVIDTGTKGHSNSKVLEITYMEDKGDQDIFSLAFAMTPSSDFVILDDEADDIKDDSLVYSSQREAITLERGNSPDFNTSGFTGLRVTANPLNFGVQSGNAATTVDMLRHKSQWTQNTLTVIDITGNPSLYSDLARNPKKVSALDADSPELYWYPEYHPMYMKLNIRIGNANTHDKSSEDEEFWYHTYHYHLASVTSSFVSGHFTQTLRLLSTDDSI